MLPLIVMRGLYLLQLRLVQSCPQSQLFKDTAEEEHRLYQKYQMTIHNDPKEKVSFKQFKRFLIDSPLKVSQSAPSVSVSLTRNMIDMIAVLPQSVDQDGVTLGSFHYQYLLDGKIIAVEVMDILPEFVSSKYLFYDPDYDFLSLGTYSALQYVDSELPSLDLPTPIYWLCMITLRCL